jgi:hypothetical protein
VVLEHQEIPVPLDKRVHPGRLATWDQRATLDHVVTADRQDLQGFVERMVNKDRRDRPVYKVREEILDRQEQLDKLETPDHLDSQDPSDNQDLLDLQVLKECKALRVPLDKMDLLGHRDRLV